MANSLGVQISNKLQNYLTKDNKIRLRPNGVLWIVTTVFSASGCPVTFALDRPLICSAPVVRALLYGRKTAARCLPSLANCSINGGTARGQKYLWKHLDWSEAFVDPGPSPAGNAGPYWKVPFAAGLGEKDEDLEEGYEGTRHRIYPLFFPGRLLWVREALALGPRRVTYAADGTPVDRHTLPASWIKRYGRATCPPAHMPRPASRITLPLRKVTLERLQEISDTDLAAEGLPGSTAPRQRRIDFARLWDQSHGRGPGSWDSNPWVIALSFDVILRNIDGISGDGRGNGRASRDRPR